MASNDGSKPRARNTDTYEDCFPKYELNAVSLIFLALFKFSTISSQSIRLASSNFFFDW